MANYGPSSVTIAYDNAAGSPVDITQYVMTVNEIVVEQINEERHPFGTSWETYLPVGVGKMGPIELDGLYDDTASSGPDALFANRVPETPASNTRTLTITFGSTKKVSVETYLVSYNRTVDRNKITSYKAKLQPTGSVSET